jgi:hypothetical protein
MAVNATAFIHAERMPLPTGRPDPYIMFQYGPGIQIATHQGSGTWEQKIQYAYINANLSNVNPNVSCSQSDTLTVSDPIFVSGSPHPPSGLNQGVSVSSVIPYGKITLAASVSSGTGDAARLEVEVRLFTDPFTGEKQYIYSSPPVTDGSIAKACVYGLADGNYHWRARTRTTTGVVSAWVNFRDNPGTTPDFSIQANQCVVPCGTTGATSVATTSTSCQAPLSVSLSASSLGGNAPLYGLDLTALVSNIVGTTINYTFYCNRPDFGTDITPGWNAKFDTVTDNPKTAYHVCNYTTPGVYTAKVVAENGSTAAQDTATITVSQSPDPSIPAVATTGASSVTQTTATLGLTVNPNGADTTAWFDWGTSPSFCCSTPPQGVGFGTTSVPGSANVAGLGCGTTYYFRARATNAAGDATPGSTLSFTTGSCAGGGTLSVGIAGTGTGRVVSNPVGIDCPGSCAQAYPAGTQVLLSPNPSPGSVFSSWSGDSACASGSVTMNADHSCTATFTATSAAYTLTVSESGSGTVTSSDGGIICGSTCSHTYVGGTTVTLAASAASGWSFSSWSGNCSGGTVVQVTMTSNQSCTANFVQTPATTPVATTGSATNIGATGATLNGTINPENFAATAYFEYGPDPYLGNATPGIPFGPGNNSFFPYAQTVTGLACATNYRFRAVGVGAGGDYIASNNTFMTAQCPPAPCYVLTLTKNGDGAVPTASPTNSDGCPYSQYHPGERITLTGSPGLGNVVTGWGDTDNNQSTATVNTLTMPSFNWLAFISYDHICYHLSLGYTGQGSMPTATNPVAYCPAGYFPWGYEVDVSANPAAGWQIAGWTGTEYDRSVNSPNFVIMPTQNYSAFVQYTPTPYLLSVTKSGDGVGTVVSDVPGINCGPTCFASYPYGTKVTLSATPAGGSTFEGWGGGACTGGVATIAGFTSCFAAFSGAQMSFYTLAPCRVVDTRPEQSPIASGTVPPRSFQLAGVCGIPATAVAVSVNATVVNPTSGGFLTLFPGDIDQPGTSNVNFSAGQTRANNAVVRLSAEGRLGVVAGFATSGAVDFVLDVNGYFDVAPGTLSIYARPAGGVTFWIGTPYTIGNSITYLVRGGTPPFLWSATGLPPGLQLDPAAGFLYGTPTQAGTFQAQITVSDSQGASASLATHLQAGPTLIITDPSGRTPANPPAGTTGASYQFFFEAQGGSQAGYTWSVQGSLPPGLTSQNGPGCPQFCALEITGTPSAIGLYRFTVSVTDSQNDVASQTVTVAVNSGPPPAIATSRLPTATIGATYSASLGATGGTPPYHWTFAGPAPDPGIQISTDGALSGTTQNTNDCPTGSSDGLGGLWVGAGYPTTYFQVIVTDATNQSNTAQLCLVSYYPRPQVFSDTPSSVTIDGASHTITLNGTNFRSTSYIVTDFAGNWPVSYIGPNALSFTLYVGSFLPLCVNPNSTGCLSALTLTQYVIEPYSDLSLTSVNFSIYNPPPTLSSVVAVLDNTNQPCTANQLCQLEVTGSGFSFNGSDTNMLIVEPNERVSIVTYPSGPPPWTQLITSAFSLPSGTYTLRVTNTHQAGGSDVSVSMTFQVN